MNVQDNEAEEEEKAPKDWENFAQSSYERFYDSMKVYLPNVSILGQTIARILLEVTESNQERPSEHTVYHMNNSPPLTLLNYMERITRYSCCSSEVFVVSLIYIDKLQRERPEVCLKDTNVHK